MSKRIVVIGGGPAGMSAAIWLRQLGVDVDVVDGRGFGGTAATVDEPNPFVPGFVERTSAQVAAALVDHCRHEHIRCIQSDVVSLERDGKLWTVLVRDHAPFTKVDGLFIATGTRFRTLDLAGEDQAMASGFFRRAGCLRDYEGLDGKCVAIVGGGDNAYCAALALATRVSQLHLIQRSPSRAQHTLQRRVAALHRTTVHVGRRVVGWRQGGLDLMDTHSGVTAPLAVDACVVAAGYVPNSEQPRAWLKQLAVRDDGVILVDSNCRTSVPGVWAIGDVANLDHPAVVTAIAMGAVAARDAEKSLNEDPTLSLG